MALSEKIQQIASSLKAEVKEKNGVFTLEATIAERKAFLSKKKLSYIAKYSIDEANKELKFTEMLKEAGSGLSMGGDMDGMSPGFGVKTYSYNTMKKERQGTIEEQSNLFGKKYEYTFDFATIREQFKKVAVDEGYNFKYQITSIGL